MSYEVFDEYKGHPRYNEFITRLYRIVNQMNELKNWYYNQCMKANRSNHLTINDDDLKYQILRENKLTDVHALEREYGFFSSVAFI
jgi:hypothetical protein